MRTQYNRVTGFKRDDRFVDGGRGRIRAGNDGAHDADRDRDIENFLFLVLADDADCFDSANRTRDIHGGDGILNDFVGDVPVAGFFNGEAGEAFGRGKRSLGDCFDDGVNLFL